MVRRQTLAILLLFLQLSIHSGGDSTWSWSQLIRKHGRYSCRIGSSADLLSLISYFHTMTIDKSNDKHWQILSNVVESGTNSLLINSKRCRVNSRKHVETVVFLAATECQSQVSEGRRSMTWWNGSKLLRLFCTILGIRNVGLPRTFSTLFLPSPPQSMTNHGNPVLSDFFFFIIFLCVSHPHIIHTHKNMNTPCAKVREPASLEG